MSRRIVIDLPEHVAQRLHKNDWHLSLGDGVRVPLVLIEAQTRIRWAVTAAMQEDSHRQEGPPAA